MKSSSQSRLWTTHSINNIDGKRPHSIADAAVRCVRIVGLKCLLVLEMRSEASANNFSNPKLTGPTGFGAVPFLRTAPGQIPDPIESNSFSAKGAHVR